MEGTVKKLHESMKGLGTDENALIEIICGFTKSGRQHLKKAYLTMYGEDLNKRIKSELSGHLEDGIVALLTASDEYEARCMRTAMKGIGTDEDTIIELLCTKQGPAIQQMVSTYQTLYNRDLLTDISAEQSGDLGKVFKALASGGRQINKQVNIDQAQEDAVELKKAGEARLGTDEEVFIRILCSRSFEQLRGTFKAYKHSYDKDMLDVIEREFSGDLRKALKAIVTSVESKVGYYAEQLYKSMKGCGTNDKALIRILVSQSEVCLDEIKDKYFSLYGVSLHDAVKGDLSGSYKNLFLTIIEKASI